MNPFGSRGFQLLGAIPGKSWRCPGQHPKIRSPEIIKRTARAKPRTVATPPLAIGCPSTARIAIRGLI
jgi:hypothetical protein